MEQQNNRTYIENMIQGDESAFDELYHSYSSKLYRMAYFITGSRSDSEDVLQETFIKCFLHRKELKDPERFEAWLYKILVRTAWKLGKRKKEVSFDEMMDKEDAGAANRLMKDESPGPLEQVLQQENSGALWNVVQKLDGKYRIVVLLYYYNELGTKEIAQVTGLLEGTVKSRLFQARKLLKKRLEAENKKPAGIDGKEDIYERKVGKTIERRA